MRDHAVGVEIGPEERVADAAHPSRQRKRRRGAGERRAENQRKKERSDHGHGPILAAAGLAGGDRRPVSRPVPCAAPQQNAVAQDGWRDEQTAKIIPLSNNEHPGRTLSHKESRMSRFLRRRPSAPMLAAVPLAIAAALAGQAAHGSAFQLKENSAEGLGRSFAGSAAASGDCSVVANNPAAMSEVQGGCFQGDVTAINFATKFHGGGEDFLGRPLTGGNGGDGGTTQPVPAIYLIHSIDAQWSIGASLTVPFGFQTEYKDAWVGRYEGLKSKLQSPALTFAASWKPSDELAIGASFIAQRTSAELSQAIDFGAILAGPTNGALLPQEADGFGSLKGDDWGYGFGLGLLWKATPNDNIGINFHSQI
ncbi:MAG TPA: outer membrane protein transport protein, partial [Dokdonella sp.]